jgi:branched-chain amino acid transport system substrate-binding protein
MSLLSRARRGLAGGLALPLVLAAGCTGDSGGTADNETVRIGFIAGLSGIYQTVGEDMVDGFELYLELNDGQLGGRSVELEIADEGAGELALPASG